MIVIDLRLAEEDPGFVDLILRMSAESVFESFGVYFREVDNIAEEREHWHLAMKTCVTHLVLVMICCEALPKLWQRARRNKTWNCLFCGTRELFYSVSWCALHGQRRSGANKPTGNAAGFVVTTCEKIKLSPALGMMYNATSWVAFNFVHSLSPSSSPRRQIQ